MALNANESPDIIIERILTSRKNYGWNFRTGELVDLFKNGVIDPVKVTRTALQNAASCAGTLITTNYGIIQTE
jgi:chaperonin GroEL